MADVIRPSNEQDINTALAWLEGPWQAAENRRGAANAAAVIRALRDAHETLPPRITVMDDGRAMGGSDACHTCAAHCTVINDLETALRGLYWDNVDYLTLNKLGGMQNHWMRAARMALGMDVDDVRPTQKALEPRTESILDRKVTVCASCLCASCWQGDFYCDNYKTASTVDKTVRELFQINANGVREDSGYWFKDVDTGKVDYYAKSAAKRAFNALSEGEDRG